MKFHLFFLQRRAGGIFFALFLSFGLMACNTSLRHRPSQAESFTREAPFEYYSSQEPEGACESGKRALLSQGYQVEEVKALTIKGEKFFLPAPNQATKLAISLVCLPSSLGAAIYANALETHYELKSHGSSAGVSVSGMGSLSLPWTADKDTLVKIGEETITAPEFYQRLFELIKTIEG